MAKVTKKSHPHEVTIYVETAYLIYIECFKNAGTSDVRGKYQKVSERMAEKFNGEALAATWLRNNFNIVKNARDDGKSYPRINYLDSFLALLAAFAGIEDLDEFDRQQSPDYRLPLYFRLTSYHLFDIIRVPGTAHLKRSYKHWQLDLDNFGVITGRAILAEPFIMQGDKQSYWIKLTYLDQEYLNQTVYLTESSSSFKAVNPSDKLLNILRTLITL